MTNTQNPLWRSHYIWSRESIFQLWNKSRHGLVPPLVFVMTFDPFKKFVTV